MSIFIEIEIKTDSKWGHKEDNSTIKKGENSHGYQKEEGSEKKSYQKKSSEKDC